MVKFEMGMEQEQKHTSSDSSTCDRLPPLSPNYSWLVVQNPEEQFFYTLHNPLSKYQCQIPELAGKRIRGCFHGWVILSNNIMWSLWNPITYKVICLPPLILKEGDSESINGCCLSLPPDDPSSVLLLTRNDKSTFVFCRINRKTKRWLRWIEMSYTNQLERITYTGNLIHSLTCCDGQVYALNTDSGITEFVIRFEIIVKDREVVIKLVPFGACPFFTYGRCTIWKNFYLKGSNTELFYILVGFHDEAKEIPGVVRLLKLDMTRINWEEIECLRKWDISDLILEEIVGEIFDDMNITTGWWKEMQDLKDTIFFVDLARDFSIFYNPEIASELGGYIHMRDKMGKMIYSYNVNDETISLSSMPCPVLPTSHVSIWECRLQADHSKQKEDEIVVRSLVTNDEVELRESRLLDLPFDVLETITSFCVGVEYLNLRATCRRCHLAAPVIQWSEDTTLRRLQSYSLDSPWLMVVNKNRGVISFTDPLLGDKYFMKKAQVSLFDEKICCSRFGWLLFESSVFECLVFFNPFTNDLRKLPKLDYIFESICFSAPPTSPDCMVVALTVWKVDVHFVARGPIWHTFIVSDDPHFFCCPIFYGRDLYVLSEEGGFFVFKDLEDEDYDWDIDESKVPNSSWKYPGKSFLMKCDMGLLVVIIDKYEEPVVLKWNDSISTQGWEKIDGLGKHMIYICETTCLCIEAKTPEMENKIYFPRVHSKSGKIVFYSLETCTYDTFNSKNVQQNFDNLLGATTDHLSAHAWIEPSWS